MKILIITNGGIGDQIHFSSLIKGLKDKYSNSEITIFCHPRLQFIYKNDSNVKHITSSLDVTDRFKLGLCFSLNDELSKIFKETEIKERIGFYKDQNKLKWNNKHALNLLNLMIKKGHSELSLSEWFCLIAEVEWARPHFSYQQDTTLLQENPQIILQYGTSKIEKNWPFENYNQLLSMLDNVWITGHVDYTSDIQKFNSNHLIGNLEDLEKVATLISKSKIVISPDSVVAHISLALRKPTIVLSSNYDRGFAFSSKYEELHLLKEKTMNKIKPERVYEEISKYNS